MAYELHIPTCICDPAHPNHPPPKDKPLRIQIEGPLVAIQRLLSESTWNMDFMTTKFPQTAAPHLARLTHQVLYRENVSVDDVVVRDEYLGWVSIGKILQKEFDYYGVTFDHLVPPDDLDPEVLQINIMELEVDQGPYAGGIEYANKYLNITVDPADYVGKKILAVPRCCSKRKGTQDRGRVNDSVAVRDGKMIFKDGRYELC